ncbi:DUF6089 family protein [Riemerella anatipestifer]|uniref:DUF6089 family protein n=1 Tax=Riemerella anatipestifer TaxID=34085 RepID=UPI00129DDA7D|nr:DUF6089 family protein [Riemerella anatipestifer]MRM84182.1 hypothetical protein [Riemerella anatipestifer]
MKKIIIGLLGIFTISTLSFAQRYEIGIYGGLSNLIGNVGNTNYLFPSISTFNGIYGPSINLGGFYKINFNPHQGVRLNLSYSSTTFKDPLSKEEYRRKRENIGNNATFSLESVFEYQFLPINSEQKESMFSPYIFGGVGAMFYSKIYTTLDFSKHRLVDATGAFKLPAVASYPNEERTLSDRLTMSVPFGIGLKYKFNYNWSLFGEITFRPTFADNIDYGNMQENQVKIFYNEDEIKAIRGGVGLSEDEINTIIRTYVESKKVGNLNSKNWVNSVALGVSYSFGRPPCYCD